MTAVAVGAGMVSPRGTPWRVLQAVTWILVGGPLITGLVYNVAQGGLGGDCHAYWLTGHRAQLYAAGPARVDAYLYSPAFAQLIRPLTWLPWPAFAGLWIVVEAATFAWLLRPLGWGWGVPAFLLCLPEIFLGNLHALFAVVLVAGFRRPGAWALVLLTKITPAVGLVWFAWRRQWRHLGIVMAWTLGIAAVSFAISPAAWTEWFRFIAAHGGSGSRAWSVTHFVAGLQLLIAACVMNKRLLLAPAMALASPVLTFFSPLTVLAAIPRMRAEQRAGDDSTAETAAGYKPSAALG
jgi:hypothetical protein